MVKSNITLAPSIARRLCCALALTLACASAFAADEYAIPPPLESGMRVRILAPDIFPGKVVGTIDRVDARSLTIDVPGRAEPISVPREKIAGLDVSEGLRSRGVDAAIGIGIGAGIGAIGGALAGSGQKGHIVSGGYVAAVCALLGAGIGGLIGVAIPPGERWHEMAASRYRVSLAPRLDHGLDLAVALNF